MDAQQSRGQFLMVGIPGTVLDLETASKLRELQPGGYILFTRNVQSPLQLRQLLNDLRALHTDPPIIAIDEEGGRVSRLRPLGPETPSAAELGAFNQYKWSAWQGRLVANWLDLFGFNLNLAPVLDLSTGSPANDGTLRDRCFSDNPQQVITHANAYGLAMRKHHLHICGKHFPSYTGATVDPHFELPILHRRLNEMMNDTLAPFVAITPDLDAVMTAHIHMPDEPETGTLPASLSPSVIQAFLRNQLGYKGLILSDDLEMGAIIKNYGISEAATLAIKAGHDMLLVCHNLNHAFEVRDNLAKLDNSHFHDAASRLSRFRRRIKPPPEFTTKRLNSIHENLRELRKTVPRLTSSPQQNNQDSPVTRF